MNPRPKACLHGFLRAHPWFWDSPRRTPHGGLAATVASFLRAAPQSFDVLVPRFNDTVCLTSGRSGTARGITPRKRIRYCQLLFFPVVARCRVRGSLTVYSFTPVETRTPPCVPPIHAGEARVPSPASRRARRRRRACRAGACPGTGPAPASSARP